MSTVFTGFSADMVCTATLHRCLQMSAVQLATEIRERRIASVQLCQLHIDQIRRVNGALNAVVKVCIGVSTNIQQHSCFNVRVFRLAQDRFAEALLEAEAVDEALNLHQNIRTNADFAASTGVVSQRRRTRPRSRSRPRAQTSGTITTTQYSADDSLPEFFGVPCTIKECFAVTGMPQVYKYGCSICISKKLGYDIDAWAPFYTSGRVNRLLGAEKNA